MIRTIVRRGRSLHEVWIPSTAGARNDYWHCEVYQVALAYMMLLSALPPKAEVDHLRSIQPPPPQHSRRIGRMETAGRGPVRHRI